MDYRYIDPTNDGLKIQELSFTIDELDNVSRLWREIGFWIKDKESNSVQTWVQGKKFRHKHKPNDYPIWVCILGPEGMAIMNNSFVAYEWSSDFLDPDKWEAYDS